jgi:hypothetical protein
MFASRPPYSHGKNSELRIVVPHMTLLQVPTMVRSGLLNNFRISPVPLTDQNAVQRRKACISLSISLADDGALWLGLKPPSELLVGRVVLLGNDV